MPTASPSSGSGTSPVAAIDPRLTITPDRASRGTVVTVRGSYCTGAALYLHDSFNLANSKTADNEGLYGVHFERIGQSISASFTLAATIAPGKAEFVLTCDTGVDPTGSIQVD